MPIECLSVGVLVADHLCSPIARLPVAGELVLTDELTLAIGGCAANAAIDLARLGVQVHVVGCVGNDPFGRYILDSLRAELIDISRVQTNKDVGTSGTLIINVESEDRRFIHAPGANNRLTASNIPAEDVANCRVLYVGGYLLLAGLDQDGLLRHFRAARAAGAKTVLDVVVPGQGDHFGRLERLLPETDVFLPNSDEAAIITGLADPQAQAERFLEAGAKTVVITGGDHGALLMSDHVRLRVGVYPVEFVGGTGAGDAFDAGYIAGLLAGKDPRGCLQWASALGASCVRSVDATQSVVTRRELEEFLARQSLEIVPF